MVVIVDQPRHNRPPVQIDHFRARIHSAISRRADVGEASLLNRHFAHHAILRIQCVDLAVDQA
jgi:hypothetical protein